ncbi:MAG: glutamate 5-kinase [Candidatus Margulisiibacteriota bacterium]
MAKKPFNTVIIKLGSSTLTTPQGKLDLKNLKRIANESAKLVKQGKRVLIVSSGAIAAGAEKLKLGKPSTIPEKQAAAAVGQSLLMRQYEKAFEKHKISVAQILLTKEEIQNSERAANTRNCIFTLLNEKVVPIINENDTVAVDEIKIGDNDNLAALTAKLIGADILVILTDVDGFYMQDENGKEQVVPTIEKISQEVKNAAGGTLSHHGTGGMTTKIQAAEICSGAGIYTSIINGRKNGALERVLSGAGIGTLFTPPNN